jgi:hypothetical protein
MIIRKSNLDILETSYDKLQSSEERWKKSFIMGELCQNQPIPVDEDELMYTMIQHNCYDDEQKLLEKLVASWDNLSQSEREVAHYLNGTSPTLESLGDLPSDSYDFQLISPKAITKNWLNYAKEVINSKPELD